MAQYVALAWATNQTSRFGIHTIVIDHFIFTKRRWHEPNTIAGTSGLSSKAPLNHIGSIVFDMVRNNMWWTIMDYSKDLSCSGIKIAKWSDLIHFFFKFIRLIRQVFPTLLITFDIISKCRSHTTDQIGHLSAFRNIGIGTRRPSQWSQKVSFKVLWLLVADRITSLKIPVVIISRNLMVPRSLVWLHLSTHFCYSIKQM